MDWIFQHLSWFPWVGAIIGVVVARTREKNTPIMTIGYGIVGVIIGIALAAALAALSPSFGGGIRGMSTESAFETSTNSVEGWLPALVGLILSYLGLEQRTGEKKKDLNVGLGVAGLLVGFIVAMFVADPLGINPSPELAKITGGLAFGFTGFANALRGLADLLDKVANAIR